MSSSNPLPQAIICDLDGTLCNIYHRQHYIQSKTKNWQAFYKAMGEDIIHEFCHDILDMYHQRKFAILLVTGRPEEYRKTTEKWLQDRGVKYDILFMRKNGDYRPDFVAKKEIYEQFIKSNYAVFFVLEDREQVVKMWRKEGLTCLQVAEGKF